MCDDALMLLIKLTKQFKNKPEEKQGQEIVVASLCLCSCIAAVVDRFLLLRPDRTSLLKEISSVCVAVVVKIHSFDVLALLFTKGTFYRDFPRELIISKL